MKYNVRFFQFLAFCGFVLCAAMNTAAQVGQVQGSDGGAVERALVYHVQGEDFSLTLDSQRTIVSAENVSGGGIVLEPSGIVHTGAGTFYRFSSSPPVR